MALFAKQKKDNQINAFLGAGTEFSGSLHFSGTVRIDGRFTGEIRSEGVLVLGRSAVVEGDIIVGRLSSNGVITGNVVVLEKAWLQEHSRLEGTLRTATLVVENGAIVQGGLEMSNVPATMADVVRAHPAMDEDEAAVAAAAS